MKINHEFVDLSAALGEELMPVGVYDVVSTDMDVSLDERGEKVVTFKHRVSLKYRTQPQEIPNHPATETNVTHG